MTTSFFNGINGMKSFQSGIDVWGNNIANINTPGFKENIPEFETLFSTSISINPVSSDIGMSSTLSSTAINLEEGSLINTDNNFDLAIGNEGWFQVKKGNNFFYTRDGSFTKDRDGYLVNSNGAYLVVANANNLIKTENGYKIDTTIDTTDLINTAKFSPISLPDNVILPAVPTTQINIKANLDDTDLLLNPIPATDDLYFSALYDKNGNALKMADNESFNFITGDITYKNNLFQKEICINDDEKDGNDITYDFYVNDKHINVTLPDGSTKEDIINALSQQLDENNILYDKTANSITIKSPNNLIIKSNNSLVTDSEGIKLTYKSNPTNQYEFNTLNSLATNLQTALSNLYPNTSVSTENGKIVIYNNESIPININISPTNNSNDLFINNLSTLADFISPNSSLSSFTFNANKKSFGGDIYEANGDKDIISFNFYKKEVTSDSTIWKAEINILKDNKIISTQTEDFTFNKNGSLINPKSISLKYLPITINTNLTAIYKTNIDTSIYSFTQNGTSQGYLTKYEVDENGNIWANFSNNRSIKVATIPIYHFQNDQGLESVGGNLFKETVNSNKAFLYKKNGEYIPGSLVKSHMLETSNTNFSQAMTELIINQKAFSAAAKTVTTSDEMIQKAINLKR